MLVRLLSAYISVGVRFSDLDFTTDSVIRYVWVLLADDDSRSMLRGTVVYGC